MGTKRAVRQRVAAEPRERIDARVAEILDEIERRRVSLDPPLSLQELTRRARKLRHAPDNASTWHDWRKGTSPKFLDLDDFAAVVGFHVGPVWQDASASGSAPLHKQGAPAMSTHAASVAAMMNSLSKEDQDLIFRYVSDLHRLRGGTSANPSSPDEESKS